MTQNKSSRQVVLKQLWDTVGPNAVWVIVSQEAAAREDGIAAELRLQADAAETTVPGISRRLSQIADEIDSIHRFVDTFATVGNVGELVSVYRVFPICHTKLFKRVLGAFWRDAIAGHNDARVTGLRHGMKVLSNVQKALFTLQQAGTIDAVAWSQTIVSTPILCDPHFHEFLDERARFAADQQHPSAEAVAKTASYIRLCCRIAPSLLALNRRQTQPAESAEAIAVFFPFTPEQAELWFIVSKEFTTRARELAEKVNSGEMLLETALEKSSAFNPPADVLQLPDTLDESARRTFLGTAFLEHLLLRAETPTIRQGLESYYRLMSEAQWDRADKRGTCILRCSKAFLNYWRHLSEPIQSLNTMVDEIGSVLPSIDPVQSPRLARDLLLTRARLRENLGTWDPDAYLLASQDYDSGLSVSAVKHELEARGRALTDYANTLSKVGNGSDQSNDEKIVGLYEEALQVFALESSVIGRSLALSSYAIYLNERLTAEAGDDQERALTLIQQAIGLLETIEDRNDYVARSLASAYLAKSNIILRRDFGDPHELLLTAIGCLRTALDRLGSAKDDQLRGITYLDLGHLNVDLYSITDEVSSARDAMYAYQEAEALLRPFPREFSQALLGNAMLVSEVTELQSPPEIEASISTARAAFDLLQNTADAQALARAHCCLGALHWLRNSEGDILAAVDWLSKGTALFVQSGNYERAIDSARRVASLHVQQYETDSSLDWIRAARAALWMTIEWIERIWNAADTVDLRYSVSDRFSTVYAELAWCQAVLGESKADIGFSIARSKGREFVEHSREVNRSRGWGGTAVNMQTT